MSDVVEATLVGGPHDGLVLKVEDCGRELIVADWSPGPFPATYSGSDPLVRTYLWHRYRWESLEPPRLLFCGTEEKSLGSF